MGNAPEQDAVGLRDATCRTTKGRAEKEAKALEKARDSVWVDIGILARVYVLHL